MNLTFLGASDSTPLAKRFVREPTGTLTTHPYPNVRDFTSFERSPESLEQALDMLTAHAEAGHCLLKGQLTRPLVNETRAGFTTPTEPTDYLLLDLDFEDGFESIDDFLAQIGLADVDYILHHSSSAGIRYAQGLRAHILMRLDRPHVPTMLKVWLQHCNLTVPGLRPALSASKMSLIWPLDVTTCQNDKLIYIADPTLDGVEDPLAGKRFELHLRAKRAATLDLHGLDPAAVQNAQNTLIGELRRELGLPNKNARYGKTGGVLLNPDQAIVTGVREARGYTYLNLNNGDSWAYWYPSENPTTVYNFKGEPPVRLQDIAPDYWAGLRPHDPIDLADPQCDRFIARDNRADTYYTCIYSPTTGHVELSKTQRRNLADFLGQTNDAMPDIVPEYDIVFDPTTTVTFDRERKWINTFRPTSYMLLDPQEIPPIVGTQISRILWSLCGEQEVYDYFMNWLAYVFQTRNKPGTAILFHGEEGTGKGLLYAKILKKLFGMTQTIEMKAETLRESHNGWAANKILVCLDEFEVTEKETKITTDLRNMITEENMNLREMRRDGREIKNFLAFLLFTNIRGALPLPTSDRRFTIAPRQDQRLEMTDQQVADIDGELKGFASFLLNYEVNAELVRRPLETKAKAVMRETAEPTGKRVLRAFREMDLQYFIDNMDHQSFDVSLRQTEYNVMIREWFKNRAEPITMTLDQFHNSYQLLTNAKNITKTFAMKLFIDQIGTVNPDRTKTMVFSDPPYPPPSLVPATPTDTSNVSLFPNKKAVS